jgi:hypothetical protein
MLLLTLLIAFPAAAWQPIDSDLWVPLSPEGDAAREILSAVDDAGVAEPLHGRWTAMAPGDTVVFAIRGRGMLRVETRPVFATDARVRRYRLGVETAPGTWRKLVRREEFATVAVAGDEMALRLGEADRWETPLVEGSERVRVTLREQRSAPVWVRVLARGELERPVAPEPTVAERGETRERSASLRTRAEAFGGAGFDANPYLVPKDIADTTAVRDAWFVPLEAEVRLDLRDAVPFDVDLDYFFDGSFYDADILGETRHKLRLRQTWDGTRAGRLRLQQQLRSRDRTFFGRGAEEEFETGSDAVPGTNVALGDRFDWRELALVAELRREIARDWETTLEVFWLHRDYTEDYPDEPDIYSLDQDRVGAALEVQRRLGDHWEVALEAELQWWIYDEKFARDGQGGEMPDVTTRLRRLPLELSVSRDPGVGLGGSLAIGTLVTDDLREGYWDRQTLIVLGELEWQSNAPWSAELRVRRSVTEYEVSTVGNDPGAPLREKDSWRVRVRGEYEVRQDVEVFGEWEWIDLENNSRTFAYDRGVMRTGLRAGF